MCKKQYELKEKENQNIFEQYKNKAESIQKARHSVTCSAARTKRTDNVPIQTKLIRNIENH